MSIKCSIHPNSSATYACEECGFLCEQHVNEQNLKSHSLVLINNNIINLYTAIRDQELLATQASSIAVLREIITTFLDKQAKAISHSQKEAIRLVKACESSNLLIASSKLTKAILASLRLKPINMQKYNESLIEQVLEKLKNFKVKNGALLSNEAFKIDALPRLGAEKYKSANVIAKCNRLDIIGNSLSQNDNANFDEPNEEVNINTLYKMYVYDEKVGNIIYQKMGYKNIQKKEVASLT